MDSSPQASREPNVFLVLNVVKGQYHLIVKTSGRRNSQLIKIDSGNGGLKPYAFTPNRDLFDSEAAALEYLKREGHIEVVAIAKHVLGYIVVGTTGLLLVAEKVKTTAILPGGHEVKTVITSKWHRIPLSQAYAMQQQHHYQQQHNQHPDLDPTSSRLKAKEEADRGVDKITSFPIDGAHFFCETLDITRPFPSDKPVCQPCWEFTWNRWLSTSFRSIGLDFACPPLLQGICEARPLEDFDGCKYSIALLSKRGRLHVGPRYKARGLNDCAEPGNEAECEQIVWRQPTTPGGALPWSRYTWRRGSVPLWWGVSIKNNGIGEAEIKIRPNNTFKGSRRYVRRLQKRYTPNPHLDPDPPSTAASPGADPSLQVPLVFVSLLRKGTPDKDRSEAKLASAFDYVVSTLGKEHSLPLTYIALDWHELDSKLGHDGIVEAYWATVKGLLPAHGYALGTLTKVGVDHTEGALDADALQPSSGNKRSIHYSQRCLSWAGHGWQAKWYRQQQGVTRYNCADSLDRTNVASFFGAVQVFVEQCRELDIAITVSPRGASQLAQLTASSNRTLSANSFSSLNPYNPSGHSTSGGGSSGGLGSLMGGGGQNNRPIVHNPQQQQSASGAVGVGASPLPKGGSSLAFLGLMGKELHKGLSHFVQDFKVPKHLGVGQVSASQMREDINLRTSSVPNFGAQSRVSVVFQAPAEINWQDTPLPQGWEMKIDNSTQRAFYVDHNTRATTWEHPARVSSPSTPPVSSSSGGASSAQHSPLSKSLEGHRPSLTRSITHDTAMLTESGLSDSARPTTPVNQLQHNYHPGTPLLVGANSSSSSSTSSSSNSTVPTPLQYHRPEQLQTGQQSSFTPEPTSASSPNGFPHPLSTPNTTPLRFGPDSSLARGSITPPQTHLAHSAGSSHQNLQDPSGSSGTSDSSSSFVPNHPPSSYDSPVSSGNSLSTPSNTPQQPSSSSHHHQSQQRHGFGSLSTVSSSGLGGSSGSLQLPGSDKAMEMVEPLTPWCLLNAKVRKFGKRVHPDALGAIAELFLVAGDMTAWLYTGSQAMHSERILIFEPETSKLRKGGVGAYGNAMVAIRRRYNNVLVDSDKQQQIEMFLGMKSGVYFPTAQLYYKDDPSVPLDFPESDEELDCVGQLDWPVPEKGGRDALAKTSRTSYNDIQALSHGESSSGGSFSANGLPARMQQLQQSHRRGNSFYSEKLYEELARNNNPLAASAAQNSVQQQQQHTKALLMRVGSTAGSGRLGSTSAPMGASDARSNAIAAAISSSVLAPPPSAALHLLSTSDPSLSSLGSSYRTDSVQQQQPDSPIAFPSLSMSSSMMSLSSIDRRSGGGAGGTVTGRLEGVAVMPRAGSAGALISFDSLGDADGEDDGGYGDYTDANGGGGYDGGGGGSLLWSSAAGSDVAQWEHPSTEWNASAQPGTSQSRASEPGRASPASSLVDPLGNLSLI